MAVGNECHEVHKKEKNYAVFHFAIFFYIYDVITWGKKRSIIHY